MYRQMWIVPLLIALSLSFPVCAQDVLVEAQNLIRERQFGRAYSLLEPLVDTRAGDPDFDYLLGIAALDSGHPTIAVFALERVLSTQPDNATARAELARAHLELGELEQAKHEFKTVRQADIPDSVSKTIDEYLAAIETESGRKRTLYNVFLQTGFGWDDNVNSATDVSQVAVPVLGGLLLSLDDTGREADSPIWNLRGGFGLSTPVLDREDLRFFGRMELDERLALSESDFSRRTLGGTGGFQLIRGRNQFRLAAQVQRFYVGGDPNRDLFGGTIQWQYSMSERTQMTVFGQAAALRFPDQEVRDADRYTGGIGFAHAFPVRGAPVVFFSGYGGVEDEVENGRPDIGRELYGFRIGGQYNISNRLVGYANFAYEDSEYDGSDPLFLRTREDEFIDVTAGFRYAIDRHWSLRPEIRFSDNDSTLAINQYDRVNVMLYVRNDF